MAATQTGSRLPGSVRRGYGLGSVATGSFGTVPGLLLLPYLTDRLGVPALVAGAIVLVPKAWDVVLNPLAGRISDRSNHPAGRRRPFLLRGGLALAACFVLLFCGPLGPTWLAAAWVALAFVACATAYAFFQVPYVAMPAEMTTDPQERTRLMTVRVAVLAVAILVSGGVSPAIRDALGPTWGYRAVGVFVAVLLVIGVLGAWSGTRPAPQLPITASAAGLAEQLRVVAGSRPFRALLGTFVLQALASGGMLAGVDYMARSVLHRPAASTILFVCFVAPAILVTPLWQLAAGRMGKRRAYASASLMMLAGAALAWWLASSLAGLAAAVAIIGVGYAGGQMLPLAMLPDVAGADAHRSGENRVGLFTGVWTAGETLGLALGPGLFALVLALGGYVSSTAGDAAQSSRAVHAIVLGFTLIPAALIALSLLPLRRYRPEELL